MATDGTIFCISCATCCCSLIIMTIQACAIASFIIGILILIPVEPFGKNIALGIVLIIIGVLFGIGCCTIKVKYNYKDNSNNV